MARSTLASPPRRTGDDSTDLFNLYDWASGLFKVVVAPAFIALGIAELTISDDEQSATYAFPTARADDAYRVMVQAKSVVDSGSLLGAAAFTVRTIERTATGFTVTFCDKPGTGNAITFDAFLFTT